jgi:glutamate synthase (NADPH/NADH) large chain
LYNPRHEHDSCSVGFVANIKDHKSHGLIRQGLRILENLAHRGAVGADPLAGDGAGILVQMPDRFLREECATQGISRPSVGEYGVGMLFLPQGTDARASWEDLISHYIKAEGQSLLGWRDVPTDNTGLGESAKAVEPMIRQVFIGRSESSLASNAFERKLFVIRKQVENAVRGLNKIDRTAFNIPSMSSRTLVYKGMLLASQVASYFMDLKDERMITALSLVYQHFSTNIIPFLLGVWLTHFG